MSIALNHLRPLALSAAAAVTLRNDPLLAEPSERVFFENMVTVFGLKDCMRCSDDLREANTTGKTPDEIEGLASPLTCGTILMVLLANNASWQVEEEHLKMATTNLIGALLRDSGLEERAFFDLIDPLAAAKALDKEVPPNVPLH